MKIQRKVLKESYLVIYRVYFAFQMPSFKDHEIKLSQKIICNKTTYENFNKYKYVTTAVQKLNIPIFCLVSTSC